MNGCPVCRGTVSPRYRLRAKTVFDCAACRIRFVDPFPDADGLKALYADSADEFRTKYFESFRDLRADSFARGLKHLSLMGKAGRLLDVGTGLGFFLDQARSAGWEAEGIELAEESAGYAREALGASVRIGDLNAGFLKEASYDVVTLWDTLEHLPDPAGALARVKALLLPGGIAVIRAPVFDSVIPGLLDKFYRISGGRFRAGLEKLFEEHLFHFSEAGVRKLIEGAGLHTVSAYREDYIDYRALGRKGWAVNPFIRFGALFAIGISHLIGRQDEVVLYAESSYG